MQNRPAPSIPPLGWRDGDSEGRADGILEFSDRIYVIELKLDSPEKAIEQIHKKGYHNPCLGSGKKIYLLGIGYLNRTTDYILEEI